MLGSALLIVLVCVRCSARDPNVVHLSDRNFLKQLKIHDNILVMFFIPWSGACQKLRPHYARAADILTSNEVPVALGKIDCSGKGRAVCHSKQLASFPSLHFYHKGQFVKDYKGSRDPKSIVRFMRVQVLPEVTELEDVYEFKKFLSKQDDVVVVGFFEDESRLKKMFLKIANEMKESFIFAYSKCEKLLRKQGVTNGIVLFKPVSLHNLYEEERILFTGRTVVGEIKNFIIKNYHGLVGHRTPSNKWDFPNPLVIVYYVVDYYSVGNEINYWRIRVIKVAHKFKKDVRFAISAMDEFKEEVGEFGRNAAVMQPIVIVRDLESRKYVMDADFSSENLARFVQDFKSHKIPPHRRSAPTSVENDGAVVVVAANSFDQVVFNGTKDVLLLLYSNQSAKSNQMIPIVRRVADWLKEEQLLVVRMDALGNEVPTMFREKGLPNIFWLGMTKKKSPVLYDGGRTVDDVIKFVAKQATKELYAFDRHGNVRTDKDEL